MICVIKRNAGTLSVIGACLRSASPRIATLMALKLNIPGLPNKIDVKITSHHTKLRAALFPRIDKLSITFDINENDKSWCVENTINCVGGKQHGFPEGGLLVDKIKSKAGYKRTFLIKMPGEAVGIVLELEPAAKHKRFARLDFNPNKIGENWTSIVNATLSYMLGKKYDWAFVCKNGYATRLDIAIELLNVSMKHVLVDVLGGKHKLKRCLYVGHSGELETLNVFQNSAQHPKLMAYDKRAEQLQNDVAPEFGSAAHTRIEILLRPTNGKLTELSKLKNPFSKVSVVDASLKVVLPGGQDNWSHFIAACQLKGRQRSLTAITDETLRAAYSLALHEADSGIWNAQKIWAKWPDVITASLVN